MLEEKLIKIGFKKNEARVYLSLLGIGPQAVSVIAKKASLNRSGAYGVLKGLVAKGVVSKLVRNNVALYQAHDPNMLIGYIDGRSKLFDYYREEFLREMEALRAKAGMFVKKPEVINLEGEESYLQVFEAFLSKSELVDIYLNQNLVADKFRFSALMSWLNVCMPIIKRKIRMIKPESVEDRVFLNHNFSNALLLKTVGEDMPILQNMIVADSQVVMLQSVGEQLSTIFIDDIKTAAMQRFLFNKLWKQI